MLDTDKQFLQSRPIIKSDLLCTPAALSHVKDLGENKFKDTLEIAFSACPHLLHLSQVYAKSDWSFIRTGKWQQGLDEIEAGFIKAAQASATEEQLMRAIRQLRLHSNYVIALSEILQFMTIEEACECLSKTASIAQVPCCLWSVIP